MAFHLDKCSILSVTRNKNLVKFNYTLHGHPLKALVCWFSWLMMFNTTFNNGFTTTCAISVSSNSIHDEVYSIQLYVIKFVSDL
jgi:hypothetical protein